ncbi:sensor histidine kinase [Streptomyces cavernae]|uniref:sensor histidine kinase n=1 Tax=Streptomyces cavernae TaxID=2259034 RepID=UPI000FEBA8B1|nr:HAMP domain-containing sensor histidine kinase [Streptomyces cavernae]
MRPRTPAFRIPTRPALRIRTRLALLNAAVFAVGSGLLLVASWLSTRQIIEENSATVAATPAAAPTAGVAPPPTDFGNPGTMAPGVSESRFEAFRDDVLSDLMTRSLLILVPLAALSVLAAVWIAGRSLSRIGQVTGTARDISENSLHARLRLVGPDDEVKELADTFDTMLDRLERSLTNQRLFTAQASHELRTPLTIQRTALEIPLAHGRVPTELEPDIRRALAATERCERLLASLLVLARGESGALHHRPTDLAELVRDALAELGSELDATGVSVHSVLGPAPVAGDVPLLAQLVANLVTNAVRHNRPAGNVRITTETDMGWSRVEVENTGPLVDPAHLPGLFEPFQRGTARVKGSGLGLAVVRAVTDVHRGRLTAMPRPEGGLTVRIEFGAAEPMP